MSLLLIMVAVAVLGYFIYDRTLGAIDDIAQTQDVRVKPRGNSPPPPLLQSPFNVLLIGVDSRAGRPEEGARSDTLIVVHVDPVEKWGSMLSIPRDTFVTIPYRDDIRGDKINSAYSWGYLNPDIYGRGTRPEDAAAALAAETVEGFLGIAIDYTAQVDFQGFQELVDAIDGITVDVPHTILDAEYPTDDNGYMRLLIEPGLQRMDGLTALRYARTRHADSDFGRAERQQQVIQAALNELRGRGLLGQIEAAPQLLTALRASVKTSMPIDDLGTLQGLAALAQEIGTDRIRRFTISPDTVALDPNYDNVYDLHWDEAEVQQLAREFQQGPGETASNEPETAKVQVLNGKGVRGLARQVTTDLQAAGFTLAEPATASTSENPDTLILDYTGKPQTRERLARFFGVEPENVRDETANSAEAPFGVDIVVLIGDDYAPQLETGVRSGDE